MELKLYKVNVYKYLTAFYRKSLGVIVVFLIIINLFIACEKQDNGQIIEEPIEQSNKELYRQIPYLLIDSNDNIYIMYGQDLINSGLYPKTTDGEFDKIILNIYNKNGENILKDKDVISSEKAILGIAAFIKNNNIYLIWKDTKNNSEFIAGIHHTYDCDIYYKIINIQGESIFTDIKLTNELINHNDADTFKLQTFQNLTISNINKFNMIYDSITDVNTELCWIIPDSEMNKHILRIIGNHMDDECKIRYSKMDRYGNSLIYPKGLINFKRIPGEQWGPEILNFYVELDNSQNINMVWQLNDGRNFFSFYYFNVNNKGEKLVYNKIGIKYPNGF